MTNPADRLRACRDRAQGDAAEQLVELARAVDEVLTAMEQYFKTRDRGDLIRSKSLERELRRRVDGILRPPLSYTRG